VVVPFKGSPAELEELRVRLARLELRREDSIVVVDNTPGHGPSEGRVPVLSAAEVATPGFARNRGAARGQGDWLVFLDADVVPSPDLLDRYFEPPPDERTAILAGGVLDEEVPPTGPAVARYAHIRAMMHQENTLWFERWGFVQTANAACRRDAFDAVGGFREDIRAVEDADLTYRLQAAGWKLERRERAAVEHRSRQSLRAFIAQRATHGAGVAWLNRHYPGSWPPRRRPGLAWWAVRHVAAGLVSAARLRSRDQALWAVLDPLEEVVLELGRSLPNERPLPPDSLLGRLARLRSRARGDGIT
jgi:glycosyltransferase involved in cell wall biosynthesis